MLRGCVPKKLMVYGGEFAEAFRDSKAYGYGSLALPQIHYFEAPGM